MQEALVETNMCKSRTYALKQMKKDQIVRTKNNYVGTGYYVENHLPNYFQELNEPFQYSKYVDGELKRIMDCVEIILDSTRLAQSSITDIQRKKT